ncbi:MAG: CarD family transcriptional regulator [Anaerotignum sp.]
MFQAGQKIVYPLHGAGFIEDIEGTEVGDYYIIRIPTGNVRIRIPKERAKDSGIRMQEEKINMEQTIVRVGKGDAVSSDNWNLRYKENFGRLKTGKLEQTAEVIKLLYDQDKKKKLSAAECRLLGMARQIVLSEIISVYEINSEKAEELLAKWLEN